MDGFAIELLDAAAVAFSEEVGAAIRVVTIRGREAINELFEFRFEVLVHPSLVAHYRGQGGLEAGLLGTDVAFALGPGGDERRGMIREIHLKGGRQVGEDELVQLTLVVVPRAWVLTQRTNSRIFQGKYVDEIVSKILDENGVRHRWSLHHTYPKRIYCTQYEETDWAFLTRILAEEGILFYFDWPEEFDGGDGPSHKKEKDKDIKTAKDVMKVVKSAAKEVKGIAKSTGNLGVAGGAEMGVGAVGLAKDFIDEQVEDEDDHPMVLGDGEAGESGRGDVFVFTDVADGYRDHLDGGELRVAHHRADAEMQGHEDEVYDLVATWATTTKYAEIRDYDFRRPLLDLKKREGEELEENKPGKPLEVYEHHGQYLTEDVTQESVEVVLEQAKRDAKRARGRGSCSWMSPGHRFHLDAHYDGAEVLAEGRYAVTAVTHEYSNPQFEGSGQVAQIQALTAALQQVITSGETLAADQLQSLVENAGSGDRAYENRFTCVKADLAYRPPRPSRQQRHATITATVMGPKGNEIYLDKYGRVKVQFHWDREGKWDENTSCWLRVAQAWAGAGYGFQFFPRCGMEVLVTFIGGDTDRPMVVGAVYNGTHATPEPLPQRMTRSGIRTQSSPGGGGFNELSFEDAKDAERIYVHAQRNLEEIVQYDRNTTIGHSEETRIGGDQKLGIRGQQRVAVDDAQSLQVGESRSTYVGGNDTSRVEAHRFTTTDGNDMSQVGGFGIRVTAGSELQVAKQILTRTAILDALVSGLGDGSEGKAALQTGAAYVTAKSSVHVHVQDDEDPSLIRLDCGTSLIEITPDKIRISADTIELTGSEAIHQLGGSSSLVLGEDFEGKSDGDVILATGGNAGLILSGGNGALTGPGKVKIASPSVQLVPGPISPNAGGAQSSDDEEAPTKEWKIKFTHLVADHPEPIADTRFVAGGRGNLVEGTTDRSGVATFELREDIGMFNVEVHAYETYEDIYPARRSLVWTVRGGEAMPPASDTLGALLRLLNLGYPISSEALGEQRVDESAERSIVDFQHDHKLPATGQLDDRTKEKIEEVYDA